MTGDYDKQSMKNVVGNTSLLPQLIVRVLCLGRLLHSFPRQARKKILRAEAAERRAGRKVSIEEAFCSASDLSGALEVSRRPARSFYTAGFRSSKLPLKGSGCAKSQP